jgi:hypothetical protein
MPENMGTEYPQPVAPELEHNPECQQSVTSTAAKIDAGGFRKIADWNGDIAETEVEEDGLSKKLRIEDKIVGVFLPWNILEDFTPIGSKATVKVSHVLSEGDVLEDCEATIRYVLPGRHSALQCFLSSANPRPKNYVAIAKTN